MRKIIATSAGLRRGGDGGQGGTGGEEQAGRGGDDLAHDVGPFLGIAVWWGDPGDG
jgi:hypothetical protein